MQNNMRTIHVGIFHLFQKTKKHAGYKTPDTAASRHRDATLIANSTELQKGEIANFYIISHFSDQRRLRRVCAFS